MRSPSQVMNIDVYKVNFFFTNCFFYITIGANVVCERLFSFVKDYWTDKKSRLSIETLKCWLEAKFNIDMTCAEFTSFVRKREDVLQKVKLNTI